MLLHPGHHGGTAFAHQSTIAVSLALKPFDCVKIDPAVDCHKGDPVCALFFDEIEKQFFIALVRVSVTASGFTERLVKGYISNGKSHCRQDLPANLVEVPANGKLHERVGPGSLCCQSFSHFGIDIHDVRRCANAGIDLRTKSHSDSHGSAGTVRVERDHDLAFGDSL